MESALDDRDSPGDPAPRGFGLIRMRGGRYELPGLPLVAAEELRRYEFLLVGVAKSLYLRDHPRRRRVPRGFEASAQLRLMEIRDSSVIPVLEPIRAGADNHPGDRPGISGAIARAD